MHRAPQKNPSSKTEDLPYYRTGGLINVKICSLYGDIVVTDTSKTAGDII